MPTRTKGNSRDMIHEADRLTEEIVAAALVKGGMTVLPAVTAAKLAFSAPALISSHTTIRLL